jgi:hypothetical protein
MLCTGKARGLLFAVTTRTVSWPPACPERIAQTKDRMKTPLLAVSIASLAAAVELAACGGGGCPWKQVNFQVAPPESCVTTQYSTCDDNNSVTLQNGCSVSLVVDYNADSGLSPLTIAPGSSQFISVLHFVSNGGTHIAIPATLGSTSIVISYDIATN